MPSNNSRWRQFQKLRFNSKNVYKNARKAETATIRHAHKFIVKRWQNISDVKYHIAGWLTMIAALVLLIGVQMVWSQQTYTTQAPQEGGTYAEAVIGPAETLNPLFADSSAEVSASKLMFSSLYKFDTSGHMHTDLATSLQKSKDGTSYTVKIRDDAKWQDGKKLTSHDVAFTVDLIENTNTNVRSSLANKWVGVDVEAPDDQTVIFNLPSANAAFKQSLNFPVVPQHILKDVPPYSLRESNFSKSPVGSGPFELRLFQTVDSDKDRKIIHLTANESYYEGPPKLARFQLHVYGDQEAILKALETNEVNSAADLASSDIKHVNKSRYEVITKPVNDGVFALFNTGSETVGDVDVRRALQLSLDMDKVRQSLPKDVNPIDLPFIKGQLSGKTPQPQARDIKKATSLLGKAGWKVGKDGMRYKKGKPLVINMVALEGEDYEKPLKELKRQWKQIGVEVSDQVIDPDDNSSNFVQSILKPRNYDVLIYKLSIGGDPDVYTYWHSSQASANGHNFASYSNKLADNDLSSALGNVGYKLRNAKYINFAKQWLKDVPAIGLYQSNMYYVTRPNITNITADETIVNPLERYSNILDWTANEGTVYKTP